MSYCVDQLEVTQLSYFEFLQDQGGEISGQSADCAWNLTFIPALSGEGCSASTFTAAATPQLPVVCVDWCDARAYCEWEGKRLCGAIAGGGNGWGLPAAETEWFNVCSAGQELAYPYGSSYEVATCNDVAYGTNSTLPPGTAEDCHGSEAPFDELYDLSGNVSEWVHNCGEVALPGPTLHCVRRGGDYTSQADDSACAEAPTAAPATADATTGIRCCADVRTGCEDGIRTGVETDVDCGGGGRCPPCADGRSCRAARDCSSGVCSNDVCRAPTCTDQVQNGGETDVDCGGDTSCPRCAVDQSCQATSDCESPAACVERICAAAA
jgi:hypothetical protein